MRAESSSSAALTSASDPPHRLKRASVRGGDGVAEDAFVAFVALRPAWRVRVARGGDGVPHRTRGGPGRTKRTRAGV